MNKSLVLFILVFSSIAAFADDTIDLQWTVCDKDADTVLKKIDQRDAKKSVGQVTYFDGKNAQFTRDGVSFRVKGQDGELETSVKVRFPKQTNVPGAGCDWDRYGTEETYTCEITGTPLGQLNPWSKDQQNFVDRYYRSSDLSGMKSFGPFRDPKWKFSHKDFKVTFDSVETKEAGSLMEFSVKVPYSDGDAVYQKITQWLLKKEVVLCARQESKTKRLFRNMGLLQ